MKASEIKYRKILLHQLGKGSITRRKYNKEIKELRDMKTKDVKTYWTTTIS